MPQLVITAVGPDRPGLVGEFSGVLHEAGANLADSRMINLRGQFAVVALVEGELPVLDKAKGALRESSKRLGLTFEFSDARSTTPSAGLPFRLKTYSMDQAGIVHRYTRYLKERNINIEELETSLESAPFAGTPVFTLEVRMTVPSGVNVPELRRALEALGDTLNCDVDLEPG